MTQAATKVIAVVGGGGAIGRAIAARFGRDGHRIALLDLDPARLHEAAQELRSQGIDARTFSCDITDDRAAALIVEQITAEYGRLDTLIHSAGLTQVSLARQTEVSVYRRVMDVNFFGVVAITLAALPHLIAAQGQIIVLSSIAGFAPLIGRTGYCASKYALHGFFETLRCELDRHRVSILLVCPSFVATDFALRGLAGDGTRLNKERSTTGRPLTTDQVAAAIHRAAQRRQKLLVLSWRGKLSYYLSRLSPSLYARAMSRRFASTLDPPTRKN